MPESINLILLFRQFCLRNKLDLYFPARFAFRVFQDIDPLEIEAGDDNEDQEADGSSQVIKKRPATTSAFAYYDGPPLAMEEEIAVAFAD